MKKDIELLKEKVAKEWQQLVAEALGFCFPLVSLYLIVEIL